MNRCQCSRGTAWLSTPAGPRCAWCVTEMWAVQDQARLVRLAEEERRRKFDNYSRASKAKWAAGVMRHV